MERRDQITRDPSARAKDSGTVEPQAGARQDDACRCKETSQMTPRELLRVMMGDLAFWKKAKKG